MMPGLVSNNEPVEFFVLVLVETKVISLTVGRYGCPCRQGGGSSALYVVWLSWSVAFVFRTLSHPLC